CSATISASDPDNPSEPPIPATLTYENRVYRTSQTFPSLLSAQCRGADGEVIDAAFEAANLVEVTPTHSEVRDGRAVVTAARATKSTTFKPTGRAASAGGSCDTKAAVWEAQVRPLAQDDAPRAD
ncbi:MAG: hypothetical protein M3164_08340, partial [Actinomycetota bacterium]|nr:hypothetical protein [Actinomycetota bacterium]